MSEIESDVDFFLLPKLAISAQMAEEVSKGDTVSWKWGAGRPEGEVTEVVEGDAEIETKNGNKVTRKGDEDDPAVKIVNAKGSTIIKKASELEVEE